MDYESLAEEWSTGLTAYLKPISPVGNGRVIIFWLFQDNREQPTTRSHNLDKPIYSTTIAMENPPLKE